MPLQDYRIKIESEAHGDILQERFEDSYYNLTIKTMLLLKWYNQNCNHVPYLLKADDDVFLNTNNLYNMVSQNTKADILIGYLFCDNKPIRIKESKWYVPESVYRNEYYPMHLNGPGYLMSSSTAQKLFRAARDVPLFVYEDIYLTGIVARTAGIQTTFFQSSFRTERSKLFHFYILPRDNHGVIWWWKQSPNNSQQSSSECKCSGNLTCFWPVEHIKRMMSNRNHTRRP